MTKRSTNRRRRLDQPAACKMALALPEAEASSHMGRPDLRVRGKIFATLPDDPAMVNLKTTPGNLDALTQRDADTFRDVWGQRWVGVRLDGVDEAEFRSLLIEAWRLAAPKRLIKAHPELLEEDASP